MNESRLLPMVVLLACWGCTPSASGEAPAPASTPPPTPTEPAPTASTTAPAAASAAPATPAADPGDGVLAADSLPAGIQPLSDQEAKEAEQKCSAMSESLAKAAKGTGKGKPGMDALLEALNNPPKIKGVDTTRCADLIRRDLLTYRARTIESEASTNLKAIQIGIASALDRSPKEVCPSAPPVPASIDDVKDKSATPPPSAWQDGGWKCTRFIPNGPIRFQYEIKTDTAAQSWEIIARGFPVKGQPPTELFVRVKASQGKLQPTSDIMRRKTR